MSKGFPFIKRQARPPGVPVFPVLLCIALFLFSCASPDVIPEYGRAHSIGNVPFYPQEKDQCGPASLAGVLNFWRVNVSPSEIAREIYSESAKGTLSLDMLLYPQGKGLLADQYSGGISDLKEKIDAGFPLIVLVDYGFSVLEAGHYMVITGYNSQGVIANSGAKQGKFIGMDEFIRIWEKSKFWTLLIRPGDK